MNITLFAVMLTVIAFAVGVKSIHNKIHTSAHCHMRCVIDEDVDPTELIHDLTYEGHDYLIISFSQGSRAGVSFTHDPDCPNFRCNATKRMNEIKRKQQLTEPKQ